MKNSLTVLICVHSQNTLYDDLLILALKSLERQTYKNFKTLIVLDGCWVNTEEIVLKNNFDLEIQFLRIDKKSGLANAKNTGLSIIDTELVAFLDGDDLYLETKLEKQLEFFEKNDVDFLGTLCYNIFGSEGTELFDSCFKIGDYETHSQIENIIYGQNILTHGSMMIKMDALRKLNFYLDIRGMEDMDLWHRAMLSGLFKFHQLQERLYIYRMFTGQNR
jgi:teichuronic acid biosynthesis glycosyltransferase TuaG